MGEFCQGNVVQSLFLKMNKECKGNLVKRFMVCLFNKFVRYVLKQVRSCKFDPSLDKFDFSLGLQKTFNLQMNVLQNNANLSFSR